MPQTSNSIATSETPYVSAAQFLQCYAKPIVADLCRVVPSAPPPSYLALLDQTNPAGIRLYQHLKIGAGEIEAACTVSKRYSPADLNALTGVSQLLLQKLNAARSMWSLAMYLKPLTARPEEVPMAKESAELMMMLKDGVLIFGFLESAEAGLPSVNAPSLPKLITPDVVSRANRLFPTYNSTSQYNRGSGRGGS